MRTFLILLAVALLSGCASYQFVNSTDPRTGVKKCSVSITSLREVDLGAISVNKDCGLSGSADKLGGGDAWAPVIQSAFERIPKP